MQQRKTLRSTLLCFVISVCLYVPAVQAQLYPGDANNDGLVNNIDVLYIGYAYGTYGPKRPNADVEFSAAAVPLFWSQLFPDSTNFAFSDTDGNGQVDISDFLTVYSNYGNKRLNPAVSSFVQGIPGFDPQLRLGTIQGNRILRNGDSLTIPIYLEAPAGEVLESVNGLAFSLELDARFYKEIFVEFTTSWLKPDSNLFQFQIPISNRIDLAVTRYGVNPVRGSGQIGNIRAVIEDDLIGLLVRDSASTSIEAKFIRLVDSVFRDVAIAGSKRDILIFDENSLVDTDELLRASDVQIFPNPSSGHLQINAAKPMQRLEVYNATGQRLAGWQLQNAYTMGIRLPDWIQGMIFIKIFSEKGAIIKKIIIQP